MANYAFLRVSTKKQNNEKFLLDIDIYCEHNGIKIKNIIQEKASGKIHWKKRKIGDLVNRCRPGDKIITPEISRLGRSMFDIYEISQECINKEVDIYAIKNNFHITKDIMSKILLSTFSLAAEIERELLVSRINESIRVMKAKGIKLGRPTGSIVSTISKYDDLIVEMLKNGKTIPDVARRIRRKYKQVYNYIYYHFNELIPRT